MTTLAAIRATAPALLTPAEEQALGAALGGGGAAEAIAILVERNQALVISIVGQWQRAGISRDDLLLIGNEGLFAAARTYDSGKSKFSTHATTCIRRHICRALDNEAAEIRLPVHLKSRLRDLKRHRATLASQLEREPTDAELAEASGLMPEQVTRAWEAERTSSTSSLDAPVHDEEGLSLHEALAVTPSAEDEAMRRLDVEHARALLATLPERDRRIVMLRYGFGGGPDMTLDEIGREVGLTRERVRQLHDAALLRLRDAAARMGSAVPVAEAAPTVGVRAEIIAQLRTELPLAPHGGKLRVYQRLAEAYGLSAGYVRRLSSEAQRMEATP